jgi:hypothetical protein
MNNIDITGARLPLGTMLYDTAIIEGGIGSPLNVVPRGNVTYQMYYSNSPNPHVWCTGSHIDETVTIGANGIVPHSSPFNVTTPGVISYKAVHNGWPDFPGPCESVRIGASITTAIIDSEGNDVTDLKVSNGSTVYDTATVTDIPGTTPSGNVTYQRYNNINCMGDHTDETVEIYPNGTVPPSSPFNLTSTGTVSYEALYNGQDSDQCESLIFASLTTAIEFKNGTKVSGTKVPVGTEIHDSATITLPIGIPSSTVTYQRFDTINCTGSHIDEIVPVNIAGIEAGTVPDSDPFESQSKMSISYKVIWNTLRPISSPCEPLTFTDIQ